MSAIGRVIDFTSCCKVTGLMAISVAASAAAKTSGADGDAAKTTVPPAAQVSSGSRNPLPVPMPSAGYVRVVSPSLSRAASAARRVERRSMPCATAFGVPVVPDVN
jgi:hypothetical protein